MFNELHLVGEAEGYREFDLIVFHISPVLTFPLGGLPEDRDGEGIISNYLGNVVDDAMLIKELGCLKFTGFGLIHKLEIQTSIYYSLPLHGVQEIVNGDVGLHEYL